MLISKLAPQMPDTRTLCLHPSDNVEILTANGIAPTGHKIARSDIDHDAPIRKFGQIIGYASQPIAAGSHVHVHNLVMGGHDQNYAPGADLAQAQAAVPPRTPVQFQGYRRADGRVGTRNYIALIATVNCSATVIRRAADRINHSGMLGAYPNVDGVFALAHGTGCGMATSGPGWDNLDRVLWGHATHPNVGAALFVGLGCEMMQIARMRRRHGQDRAATPFHALTIQDSGGTQATIDAIVEKVALLLRELNQATREAAPVSELTIGLQCGGSDGVSGITANPALGWASDLLVAMGGTSLLSETPEIYGAEQLLLRRAVSAEVAEKLLERIRWWEDYTQLNNATMDNNPSPGNKAGGLTTILEKSLGAVAKSGGAPLSEVVAYAEKPRTRGLIFMDTPGYDPVSVTGQIAGGAQLIVFTTGRGSAFGSKPAPTLKLATNDALYRKMRADMDLGCGDILSAGTSVAHKGQEVFDAIVATASGHVTKSEALGLGDFECLPWQIGAVM